MLVSSFFASLWISSTTQFLARSRNLEIKSKPHAMFQIYGTYASWTVLLFSRQTGEPLINISSTPPSNELSIGAAINLTCTAWQTNELAKNSMKRPHIIEWFDPQDKRIGIQCRAGSQPARLMNCTLEVGALTDGKLGNYTCQASNGYNYCSTKQIQIGLQGKWKKARMISCPSHLMEHECVSIKLR